MKLYVTMHLALRAAGAHRGASRRAWQDRVEIVEAKTRTPGSPYYADQPIGPRALPRHRRRRAAWRTARSSAPISTASTASPRFHPASDPDWSHRRLEAYGAQHARRHRRVGARECPGRRASARRPPWRTRRRAPTRIADFFEAQVAHPADAGPAQHGATGAGRSLGDGPGPQVRRPHRRPAARSPRWLAPISQRPAMLATTPPKPR